jgi:hypothetical protein
MPLQRTTELGRYNASSDYIYFFMADAEKRVTCSITEQALLVLDDQMIRSAQGRLAVFYKHREFIEAIASKQYDLWKFEPDGKSILIREADVRADTGILNTTDRVSA